MKRVTSVAVAVLAAMALGSQTAQASQMFDFSFTNTTGTTAGTVTGEIVLPFNGDGTAAATHVYVDSAPAGLSISTFPFDTVPSPWGVGANTFTVTGGHITSASTFGRPATWLDCLL